MSIKIPKKNYPLIDEGVYQASIGNIEKCVGNYGEQIKFRFDISNGINLPYWTSISYSEKSKLFGLAKSLLGDIFDPKADFDSDWLLGISVLVQVSKRIGTDGNTYNKIENIMSLPKQSTTQQSAPSQPSPQQPVPVQSTLEAVAGWQE